LPILDWDHGFGQSVIGAALSEVADQSVLETGGTPGFCSELKVLQTGRSEAATGQTAELAVWALQVIATTDQAAICATRMALPDRQAPR
jgi:hypothetical protein